MNDKKKYAKMIVPAVLMLLVLVLAACGQGEATQLPAETAAEGETQVPAETPAEPVEGEQPTQAPAPTQAQPMETEYGLVDTPWVLIGYGDPNNPTVVEAGVVVTAHFGADGSLTGSSGCNTYNTTYQADGNNLVINTPIAVTAMACETGMEMEQFYLGAYERVLSYEITPEGSLRITYDGNQVLIYIAQRAPLEGTLWTLVSYGPLSAPTPAVAGTSFTATFNRNPGVPTGLLAGNTGCNDYTASYFNGITNLKVNMPGKTENPNCAAGVPEQEQLVFGALNAARNYRILGETLQVFYGEEALNFSTGVPAPAPEPTAVGGPLSPLNGTKWWLATINEQPILPGTEITAEFFIDEGGTTGSMGGLASCNNYNATITGVFTVSLANVTQQLCSEPAGIMDQEQLYLATLGASQALVFEPGRLVITTGSGTLVYLGTPPVEPVPPTDAPPAPTEESGEVTALISVNPESGTANAGQTITFDASGSTSNVEITQYSWDMGDGTLLDGQTVNYDYQTPGDFTVQLSVVDANGAVGQASILYTVIP